jgi:hypothetical protein
MRPHRALGSVAIALALAGCAGGASTPGKAPGWVKSDGGQQGARSGFASEAWFPLAEGRLYQYATTSGDGTPGLLVARVHRTSSTLGELRTPAGTRRFQYAADGVLTLNKDGVWAHVVKLPVDPATTWRGEHGGKARWDAGGVAVEVEAGRFEGCGRVVEERGGDRPARFATTFCPTVGVVLLEATQGDLAERAELTYFGEPLDIGPEGTKRVQ